MATVPVSYYWLTEVALALETNNIRAVEAFVEMHGVKVFQINGKDCIKSTDLPKITKGVENSRKESRLLIPLVFAAKELGITENALLLMNVGDGVDPVMIEGARYIEKSKYLASGGTLLKAQEIPENQDQGDLDF